MIGGRQYRVGFQRAGGGGGGGGVSWAQFKENFLEKFYHTVYKDQKIEDFFKLEQGTGSVTDYEKKFSELVQHVPLFCDHEV